jgi:hypothetical protein
VALRVFCGEKYGCSKGYPQRNAAHMGSVSLWIYFVSIFFAHKKRTTSHCSNVVQIPDAACWIYIGILLEARHILHISRISVKTVNSDEIIKEKLHNTECSN